MLGDKAYSSRGIRAYLRKRRIKATIHDVAAIEDHAAAVDRELEPQVWSLEQPAFKERVAALQAKITKK